MSFTDQLREKWYLIVAAGLLWVAAADMGYVTGPGEIEGIGVVFTGLFAAGVAGYLAAGKVEALLPDPTGIYLVAFDASEEAGGSLWELSEDQFEALEVESGTLHEWEAAERVYECRTYDPETNVAVANWRESVSASHLAGETTVVEALDQIAELRQEFEPEARKSRRLRRRVRSIVRRLDRRRLRDQQQILDPTTNPDFTGDQRATVSEVIREELPEDLQPESMQQTDAETVETDEPETIGFDVLDDEPDELLNDGGSQ